MIAGHLPILQVALPLIAAPICVLLRQSGLAWAFATLVSWALLAISIMLLIRVMVDGVISYHLGGWAPPWLRPICAKVSPARSPRRGIICSTAFIC